MSLIGDLTARLGNIVTPSPRLNSARGLAIRDDAERQRQGESNILGDAELELTNQISRYDAKFQRDGFSPIGSFQTQEQYNQFKQDFDPTRVNPSDYLDVYGAENGIRVLNTIGFSQGLLGADSRFDENLSTYEFGGEFTPYVRKLVDAEGTDGRFVSVPLNIDGVPAAEALQTQGADGAPAIGATPEGQKIVSRDSVGKEFPVGDITINLKEGGLNSPFALTYSDFKNQIYRVPQAESFAESIGLQAPVQYFQEDTLPTIASILSSDNIVRTPPEEDVVPPPADISPNYFGVQDTGFRLETPDDFLQKYSGNIKTKTRSLMDEVGPYILNPGTHPFAEVGLSEEEFLKLSPNDRAKLVEIEKRVSETSIRNQLDEAKSGLFKQAVGAGSVDYKLKGNLDTLKATPGVSDEDVSDETFKKVTNFLKNNLGEFSVDPNKDKSKLARVFIAKPELFEEFKEKPYEFGLKYYNNTNELFGSPQAAAALNKTKLNTKLDEGTVNNIILAAQNQNIGEFRRLITDAIENVNMTEEGQQALTNLLQTYNGDFRRASMVKRAALVGDMLASLAQPEQNQYMPYLMRFLDSGELSFEDNQATLNQRKQDALEFERERNFQTQQTKLSSLGTTILNEYDEIAGNFTNFIGDRDAIQNALTQGANYLTTAYSGTNLADIQQAESFNTLALKAFIINEGKTNFWQNNFLTGWMFRDVSVASTDPTPNIRGFNKTTGEMITDPARANEVDYFQIVDTNNRPQGDRISRNLITDGTNSLGTPGLNALFNISILKEREYQLRQGG